MSRSITISSQLQNLATTPYKDQNQNDVVLFNCCIYNPDCLVSVTHVVIHDVAHRMGLYNLVTLGTL